MADQSEITNCPKCGEPLIVGKLFCPTCGQAIAPSDHKAVIDSYIVAKVVQELSLRVRDETMIVRDLGNKAEDEVWKRLTRYSWVVAAVVALLGLYGFSSIRDAKQKVVEEARGRVEPVIKDVEAQLQSAQAKVADVERRLPAVTDSLNRTAVLAEQQRTRIEGQSAEVTSKLNGFQQAAVKADQVTSGFETKVKDQQQRLDNLSKRYDSQIEQVSRSTAHESVLEAYPTLDQEPFVMFAYVRSSSMPKRIGEKWVNIYLTGQAISKSTIPKYKLEQLIVELRANGFVPIVGIITLGGRLQSVIERTGKGSYDESGVLYFRPDFKSSANVLNSITSKYIQLPTNSPQLSLPSDLEEFRATRLDVLIRDGKLDAQIFISTK